MQLVALLYGLGSLYFMMGDPRAVSCCDCLKSRKTIGRLERQLEALRIDVHNGWH